MKNKRQSSNFRQKEVTTQFPDFTKRSKARQIQPDKSPRSIHAINFHGIQTRYHSLSFRLFVTQILLVLFLLVTASCGTTVSNTSSLFKSPTAVATNTPTPTAVATNTPTPTAVATNTPTPTAVATNTPLSSPVISASLAVNKDVSLTISSLNIQATAIRCSIDDWLATNGLLYSGGNLVITSPNSVFDAGSLKQLTDSVDKDDPSLLPQGFTSVLGALTINGDTTCSAVWQLTNTSQNMIQVQQLSMKYDTDAQLNTYHYNVINLCSLHVQKDFCGGQRGGGGGGPAYFFSLDANSRGTTISSPGTQPLFLAAGQTVPIEVIFTPANHLKPNYVYSLIPEITLNSSSQPLQLTQLASTVAFLNKSNTSCYQLTSQNTFVEDPSLDIPTTKGKNYYTFAAECV